MVALALITKPSCYVVLALAIALGGCATLPAIVETRVQRVESMASLDQLGDELGADDWRLIEVTPQAGDGSFVGVFQRATPRWNVALLKKRGLHPPPTSAGQ